MTTRWMLLVVFLFLARGALASVVETTDGRQFEGKIARAAGGWEITDAAGNKVLVKDDQVKTVRMGDEPTPGQTAAAKLAALRKQTEKLDDINEIIKRYERLVVQTEDAAALREAQKDLELWRSRKDQKLMKVGSEWLSAKQREELLARIVPMIEEARQLVKREQPGADASVAKILELDPNNAAGLYLKGLLHFKLNQIAPARTAWNTVREQLPDHGPTLNNLAVVAYRQSSYLPAVGLFDQAIAAMPDDQRILNNMLEALEAVPVNQRNSTTYTRAADAFERQDRKLREKMQEQGLYRWGSSWVKQDELTKIEKANQEVTQRLDALNLEYQRIRDRISQINLELEINQDMRRRVNRDRTFIGGNGQILFIPPGVSYYDLRRVEDSLRGEQAILLGRLDTFGAQAAYLDNQRPYPEFGGAQTLIGVEGTPLTMPGGGTLKAAPTTQKI